MERTVTYILDKLAYTIKEINRSKELETKYQANGKYSRLQSQVVHTQALLKRSKSLKKELEGKIFGNILEITYLITSPQINGSNIHQLNKATLTNVNEKEAQKLMTIWAKTYQVDIKILEIKKIPAYIGESPL